MGQLHVKAEDILLLTDAGKYDVARSYIESLEDPSNTEKFLLIEIYLLQNETTLADKLVTEASSLELDSYHQLILKIMQAIVNWFEGDIQTAKSLLDTAFDYLNTDKMQDRTLYYYWIAFLYNTAGIIDILIGKTDDGKSKFEKAYPLAKQSGSGRRIAAALDNLAIAERYLGNYDAAIVFQHRVLDLRLELGDKRGIAITKGNLGELYEITGDLNQSLSNTKESLELFKELEIPEEIGQCHHNLGRIYYEQNKLDDAHTQFKQALEYRQPLGISANIAMVLYYLIITSLKLDKSDSAASYLEQLESYYDEEYPIASLYYSLGKATYLLNFTEQNNTQEASQLLDNVIEQNSYDVELTYIAIIQKISILFRQPDGIDTEQIFSYISQLKQLAHEKNNPMINVELYLLESKFYMLDGDIDKAIDLLNNAEELAKNNKLNRLMDKINNHRQHLTVIIKYPDRQSVLSDKEKVDQYLNELLRRFHRSQ